VLVVALIAGGVHYRLQRQRTALTSSDTIVVADFSNSTGDVVFDDTLETALIVSLRQSPFLNVLSHGEIARTLRLMTLSPDTKLTPDIARELCQRARSKAYVAGAIGSLANKYVLELKAVNCDNGTTLAEEEITAESKVKVLDALGNAASKMRAQLGESLATVQQFDIPLSEASTASLEALKAYSLGSKAYEEKGTAAALPYYGRAIELDPTFAMGYEVLAISYANLAQVGRANEYYTKAFELREHASEPEKLMIAANYYSDVTGELDKAAQTYQEQIKIYPRAEGYRNLATVYAQQGEYEKAIEMTKAAMRLAPDRTFQYDGLANYALASQRVDEARTILREAQAHKLDDAIAHNALYAVAFLERNAAGMKEEQQWFANKPEENFGLELASDTEAYGGHVAKARELVKLAVASAIRNDSKEAGAIWVANTALQQAAYGNRLEARQGAAEALKLAPNSQGVESEAALAFAMAGDPARAEFLAQDLARRFPLDSQMQSLWLPAIRTQVALDRKSTAPAQINRGPTSTIDLGAIPFVLNISCLYHLYIQAEAHLASGQGSVAAAEFQKILDHSGIVWNCWTGSLAHLGVARANALEARTSQGADADAARTRALAAYKDFLALWKDADQDVPILKQAKSEYTKLE
jgi:eukaryotic-like serine/threonine-protein kinase